MLATGRRAAGFTLIEALVVVAITGLISALAFPRLEAAIAAQEFRTSTATLVRALQGARAQAIRSGDAASVAIAEGGHSVAVADAAPVMLPADYVVSSDQASVIRFFPDGTSTGGRLVLVSQDHRVALSVQPSTGRVTVGAAL
ncbi:MAG: Tfp pilus assembly protein FimT/FimU [Sphingomonas sp.]